VRGLNRSWTAIHRRGIAAMGAGQHRLAAEAFQASLLLDPKHVPTRVSLATCRLALGQPSEAGDLFLGVLSEEPGNESARKGLALALAHTGRLPDALRLCDAWRLLEPTNNVILEVEGEVRWLGRDYPGAAAAYGRLMARDPGSPLGPVGLATAQAAQGRHNEARRTLEQAAEALADRPEILLPLARVLVASPDATVRDPVRGLTMIDRLATVEALITVWETKALALAANGRWPEARALFDRIQRRLGDPGPTALKRRLDRVQAALAAGQTYQEPWPFADPPLAGTRTKPGD